MIGQRQIIMLVATLAVLGAAFGYGYHKGSVNQIEKQAEIRQQLQQDVIDLEADLSVKAAEILALQIEREGLIDELEQAALNAEGAGAPGVATTGGLRRLERRWSTDSGTSD